MNPTNITDAVVIPKHYIAFDSIAFVCGALSKDEDRVVLTHILVEREGLITRFVATDGRRMHIGTLDPGLFDDDIDILDPGLYLLISKSARFIVLHKSDCKLDFPKWKSVLGNCEIGDNLAEVCNVSDSGKIGEVMIRTGKLLDTAFLSSAMGYGTSRKSGDMVAINFETQDDSISSPVIISHDHGTAVVMPMRRVEPDLTLEDGSVTFETAPIEALKDAMEEGDTMEVNGKEVFKK